MWGSCSGGDFQFGHGHGHVPEIPDGGGDEENRNGCTLRHTGQLEKN